MKRLYYRPVGTLRADAVYVNDSRKPCRYRAAAKLVIHTYDERGRMVTQSCEDMFSEASDGPSLGLSSRVSAHTDPVSQTQEKDHGELRKKTRGQNGRTA